MTLTLDRDLPVSLSAQLRGLIEMVLHAASSLPGRAFLLCGNSPSKWAWRR